MKLTHTLAAALLAAGIALSGHANAAKADPDHFLLTPALIQKFEAMKKDVKDDGKDNDDDEGMNPKDADDMIRKLDKDPKTKAMLAKYGITTREYALAMFAMLHAGFYVGFEKEMDKKKAAEMYNGFTKEQRANVDLMRKMYAKK